MAVVTKSSLSVRPLSKCYAPNGFSERRAPTGAGKYAETHDPLVKVEVEAISRGLAGMLDN